MWTDKESLYPQTDDEAIWWEVWVRLADDIDRIGYFREHANALGLRVNEREICFVDRAVLLAYGTRADMIRSMNLLGVIGELRKAKEVAGFFTEQQNIEQIAWVNDALPNIDVSVVTNAYVCILDTGINEGHPLLQPVISSNDVHTSNPNWGTHDGAVDGHGTPMAGLVAYGDLVDALQENQQTNINFRIESVKILPNDGASPNPPDIYGAVTEDGISQAESTAPARDRVYCMAVSTDDRDKGKPSSWSAKIDQLAIGEDDDPSRLIILSAGNMPEPQVNLTGYPESNRTHNVQDPGQAWNAVTVGAYTEKVIIDNPELASYRPVADRGDLSPVSTTSIGWDSDWPLKPEIVMEGGNWGVDSSDDGFPDFFSGVDDLELLSTHHNFNDRALTGFRDTSAAAALAARLAVQLRSEYPNFWPETVRGLLIHSADWTDQLKSHFDLRYKGDSGYASLLRFCGYGVPDPQKMLWSANNHLTLIAEDTLQPFFKDGSTVKTKHINMHELPWPDDVLLGLGGTNVQMKVTLSYFIEPNPGQRGWKSKYSYASHRLKFDVLRAGESLEEFNKRVNKKARETGYQNPEIPETGNWVLGSNLRSHGSVHSDTWSGTAADLAERKYIAIYPMNGWWKELKKQQGWDNRARYSLIVSIETPETDIYTSVENQIDVESIIEI